MRKLLLFLWPLLIFSSCQDHAISPCAMENEHADEWLRQKIESYKHGTKAEIYSLTYNGKTVIEIKDCVDCADGMTTIYNCSGTAICQFGGIAGLNTCPDFYQEATGKNLLWKN